MMEGVDERREIRTGMSITFNMFCIEKYPIRASIRFPSLERSIIETIFVCIPQGIPLASSNAMNILTFDHELKRIVGHVTLENEEVKSSRKKGSKMFFPKTSLVN